MTNEILVRSQATPNPFALKFIVNQSLKTEGKATFHVPEEAEGLPLVNSLFQIPGVKQVHVFNNTLTVTHGGDLADEDLAEQVSSVIQTRFAVHDPSFLTPEEKKQSARDRSQLSSEILQIEEVLDRTIRPGLQADGGDIEVIDLVDNELKILYQGACGGCPSAMMGTLDAIQNILQHELENPELQVVPI